MNATAVTNERKVYWIGVSPLAALALSLLICSPLIVSIISMIAQYGIAVELVLALVVLALIPAIFVGWFSRNSYIAISNEGLEYKTGHTRAFVRWDNIETAEITGVSAQRQPALYLKFREPVQNSGKSAFRILAPQSWILPISAVARNKAEELEQDLLYFLPQLSRK